MSSIPIVLIYLWIMAVIYLTTLTSVSIYYIHKLKTLSLQNIPWISKRHPKLIVFSAIVFNLYPTIFRPIGDYFYAANGSDSPIANLFGNIIQWYLLLEYMRLWLLYYDYKFQVNSLSLKWKQHILKEQITIPWTHKYRWLGNVKILCIIYICFCLFIITIIIGSLELFGAVLLSLT
eukprot:494302_1